MSAVGQLPWSPCLYLSSTEIAGILLYLICSYCCCFALCGFWGSNTGLHACQANILLYQLSCLFRPHLGLICSGLWFAFKFYISQVFNSVSHVWLSLFLICPPFFSRGFALMLSLVSLNYLYLSCHFLLSKNEGIPQILTLGLYFFFLIFVGTIPNIWSIANLMLIFISVLQCPRTI